MKKLTVLAAAAAALCSFNAAAQNVGAFYGEVGYVIVTAKDVSSNNIGTFKPSGAWLTLGNVIVDNLAVEGYLVEGLSSDAIAVGNAKADIALKTSYGVGLRPFVHLTDDLELYGRLGSMRTKSQSTVSFNGQSVSESSSSTRTIYGIGLAYKLTNTTKLVADYVKFSNKEDTRTSSMSVGVRFSF